jgi:hypothetical protein
MPDPALRRSRPLARVVGTLALVAALAALGWLLTRPDHTAPPEANVGLLVDRSSGNCESKESNDAGTTVRPFCSISAAVASAEDDDVIQVRAGSYPPLDVRGLARAKYLTIRPRGRERVRLQGAYIDQSSHLRLRGLRITGPVLVAGSDHIQLVRNDVSPRGLTVRPGSSHLLIARNRIHDLDYSARDLNGGYAVLLAGGGGGIRDVTVRGNHISGIPIDGIQLTTVTNLVVEGNEIEQVRKPPGSDVHSDAIQLLGGTGIVIRSNYIHDTSHGVMNTDNHLEGLTLMNNVIVGITGGFGTMLRDASPVTIANNTFWDTKYGVVIRRQANDVTMLNNILNHFDAGQSHLRYEDHNMIPTGATYGPADILGPPQFVNPGAGDYRLAPGSPGTGAGTAKGAPRVDRHGRRRGNPPDLGADEGG